MAGTETPSPKEIALTVRNSKEMEQYETSQQIQTIQQQKDVNHICCPFCQSSQRISYWVCNTRLCGDECCLQRKDAKCCRPSKDEDKDWLDKLIAWIAYLLCCCCIWELIWTCCCLKACKADNKWCCLPCDLLLNSIFLVPLVGFCLAFDVLYVMFGILFLLLDPICCILSGTGKCCRWKCGHNTLCCCTVAYYEDKIEEPDDDNCSLCYCYKYRETLTFGPLLCIVCLLK
eukprot:269454_1